MIERREFEMDLEESPMLAGETPTTYARRRIDSLKEGWSVVRVDYWNDRQEITDYSSRVPHEILFTREVVVAQAERFRKDSAS